MSFILISSFTMVFESPAALEDKSFSDALEAVDIVFTIIFLAEMCMKIVAYGIYFEDPDAYLRDPWNCMDGFIVVIGIVGKRSRARTWSGSARCAPCACFDRCASSAACPS